MMLTFLLPTMVAAEAEEEAVTLVLLATTLTKEEPAEARHLAVLVLVEETPPQLTCRT
jgi:hypothetical protein